MYTIAAMKIITTREFRENQKKYFDLAEKERVIIHRGKKRKSVLLTPIEESEETDIYFSDPQVKAHMEEGIKDIEEGRYIKVNMNDLKNLLGLE